VAARVAPGAVANLAPEAPRRFIFTYEMRIDPTDSKGARVEVFVPRSRPSGHQKIVSETIEASVPGSIETEPRYGNRYWHGSIDAATDGPIDVRIETVVERRAAASGGAGRTEPLSKSNRELFLAPNERVVVGDEILEPILAEVRAAAGSRDPADLARATYDWVVDNVEYKKTGTGWGNGDTFWACTERYGNCTDFHALFISLARSLGIPARFEIGFPIPEDRSSGEVGGYHCWVEFFLPESGWIAIDASEAFKNPEKREFYYGGRPNDRIHFTTGRDLRLGSGHTARPLNYFVYPYVEVAGESFSGEIVKRFSYRNDPSG
jgi:transglutaminase-like putative cysteine protease